MVKENYPFVIKHADTNTLEYMGSDGLPITQTYNLYLKKCEEFKAKAKKYAKDNMYLKKSILHHTQNGYESSEQLEEEILLEREEHLREYQEAFDVTSFDKDPNTMYECFTGKSKRIRIIRESHEIGNEEFSAEFENKAGSWFTRYCILSRFIECARKIILINRLNKALDAMRALKPKPSKISREEINRDKHHLCGCGF